MRLDLLVERSLVGTGLLLATDGDATVEISSVTLDSRRVGPAAVFACVPGRLTDGHDHAHVAVAAGAVALLCERPLGLGVPQVIVSSVRAALGPLSGALHAWPSEDLVVVGVTGTNGKTTTAILLASVLEAHGWKAASLGTLTQARTTPEAPELQERLAGLRRDGFRAVAMEVSSHALDQHRVDGIRFAAGVFTNLTQDHLDYHATMENYFAAKARLFDPGRCGVAVVNRDDLYGRRLVGNLEASGSPVVTFGAAEAEDLRVDVTGSRFRWRGEEVHLALGGRFNVSNALAAATTAGALGIPAGEVAAGLAAVTSVRGRFERVDAGQDFTVLVDYAHTPDGLLHALTAARELATGRLVVVFGAGGDRDHDKRPEMGRVAAEVADLAVVTSDNPRSEDPGAIIADVVAGAADPGRVRVVPDRAEAIETAVWVAGPGDVVVVAGKGHESGQEIRGQVRPFDDAEVTRRALERLLARRGPAAPGRAG
ncbi:MAG: UDP-N-acetylmuramoyl-L-alanyl-D-glutamate--2,6-diaminopimelate ligase [Actinomycetota bacterium]|nr:UDP-N-acetylmuramoyl-L-alanyl-D-glutamate--2,6-diaminopimelate ligase [Actinomycetota bacterium]